MKMMIKAVLDENEVPRKIYNILPDLPVPLPEPQGNLGILPKIFPKGFLAQEMSGERYFNIPDEVRDLMITIGRPTPLQRAIHLEKALGTPAKIFFKREDTTVTGSHKINSALMQAYLAREEGITTMTTETGAGQWGSALSLAGSLLGVKVKVYMVRCSYEQKPFRKYIMQLYGADVVPSPSNLTEIGRKLAKDKRNYTGSLGIAIAEAIEEAKNDNCAYGTTGSVYGLGSVLNAVLAHQTVIGLETEKQLQKFDVEPDVLVGCTGGGSNFGGLIAPFYKKYKDRIRYVAAEPTSCPSLTKGEYKYDYGDTGKQTPLLKMHTMGCDFIPPSDHAGGLRYHGMSPIISLLKDQGIVSAKAYSQDEIFGAGQLFAKTEGVIPAPETNHAIRAAIDEAMLAKKAGVERVIVMGFSGHGLLDLNGYAKVLNLKG
jgi:tryptophan synthase beta chain